MATLLHEQNFAAGPSAFCVVRRWELRDTGANDAPDALYPAMIAAESNDVLTGLGPGGENVLARKAGGDASNAGCWLSIPGPATASPGTQDDAVGLSVAEGWVEVAVCPRAAYLAENDFAPLLAIDPNGGPGGWLYCQWAGSVIAGKKLQFGGHDFALDFSQVVDMATLANQWQKVVIAFKASSAAAVADGYARLYFGPHAAPALIYDHSGIVVNSTFGYPGNNIRGAYLGFAGMIGDMTNLRVYSGTYPGGASPTVLVNNSAECCSGSGVEGSGVAAPGAGVAKGGQVDPSFTSRVEINGVVPTYPDLTDPESWVDS